MEDAALEFCAALARALLYGAMLSCTGVVLANATLRSSAAVTEFLGKILRYGAWTIVFASLVGAIVLFARLGGQLDKITLAAIFFSSVGAALCLQVVGAVLLLTAQLDDPHARGYRIGNAVLTLFAFAFNGHAASVGLFAGLLVVLHAGAAAWWIGGLFLLSRARVVLAIDEFAALVRRFSSQAVKLIGLLLAAGSVLILELIDFERVPWFSDYVRILALKLGIVATVLSVAVYNKLRVTPWLASGDSQAIVAAATLRRTINVELSLIAAILITTAVLTTYTAPE